MSSWSPENSVITNLGNSLLANARLGLGAIKITRVVARENFEENISLAKQYTLADITSASIAQTGYVVDMKVTSYPDPEEEVETSLLTVRFTNEDLASASATYNLRQIIVLAQLINPNTQETIGDEVPYMVSQCDDEDDCDVMPAREINPTSFDYNLYIIHSGVESVTIEIRTTGYVFESEYNADKTEIWVAINSLESGSVGQGTNGVSFETWSPVYNETHTSWSSEETGDTELGVESAERFNDYSENHNIVTGLYSSAFGHNTEVLSGYSATFGDNNYVGSDAPYSFIAGRYNSILAGNDNTIFGKLNEVKSGDSNIVYGGSCCLEDSEYTELSGYRVNAYKSNRSSIGGSQSNVKGASDSIIRTFSSDIGSNAVNSVTGSVVVGSSIDMQHQLNESLVVGYDIQSSDDISGSLIVGRGISVASDIYAVGFTLTATGSCLSTFITGSTNTVNASQSSHISGSGNTVSSSYTSHVSGYSNTLSSSPQTSVSGWLNQVTGGKCNTVGGHNNKLNNSEVTDVFGVSNTVTDCNNSTVRGGGNTATSSNTVSVFGGINKVNMGNDHSLVSGYNNTVSHSKRSIISGLSLNIDYSNDSLNVGRNNSIYGTKQNYSNIISGDNNTVHNDGGFGNTEIGKTLIVGSNNNVADYINCVIGGDSNSLANVSGSSVIGKSNVVSVFSNQSRSFGTRNCDISGQSNSVTQFESSVITGKNNSLSDYKPNGVAGEWGNSCHSVVSGESNLIQGLYSSTVCGTSNTITNVHDSFIAGRGNSVSGGNTPISGSTNSIIVVGSLNTVNNAQSAQAVFGTSNTVSAGNTLTSGSNLINSSALATVLGKFNEADTENTYAVIVGGGTDSANRSNIAALDWSGGFHSNSIYTSQIYKPDGTPFDFGGGTNYIAEGSEIGSLLLNDVNSTVSGEFSLSAGYNNRVAADNSVAIGQGNTLNNTSNDAIVIGNSNSVTLAPYSIIGGKQNTVNFAPENILISYQSRAIGGVQYTAIVGGVDNEVVYSGYAANMRASAIIGGIANHINIEDSQVEEDNVAVPQTGSVILGGSYLRTPAPNCIVAGTYNAFDSLSSAALIIGNGTSSNDRHNALVVDTSGNIFCNGNEKSLNELHNENRAELIEIVDSGDKNVLSFTEIGTNNSHGSTFTSGGVTWTLNADFTITATRTESSTTDSSCNLRIDTGSLYVDGYCTGGYVLSGCPEGGGEDTYSLRALRGDDYRVTDTGDGIILPEKGTSTDIYINMLFDKEFDGTITFKPMICTKAEWAISKAYKPHKSNGSSGGSGATVYTNSDYTITPYSNTDPHVDNLSATADGYLIGNLQTVHISGSYNIYYSVSSDTGYKICDITVPGNIADPEKEIAVTTNFDAYLSSGSIYNFYVAKIETVDTVKKLAIYFKSMGCTHGSSGQSFTFDITATFKVS